MTHRELQEAVMALQLKIDSGLNHSSLQAYIDPLRRAIVVENRNYFPKSDLGCGEWNGCGEPYYPLPSEPTAGEIDQQVIDGC